MKCSNCGKDLAEGNLFCDGCGTRVVAEQPAPAPVQAPVQPMPQQPYYGYPQPPKKGKGMLILVIIMAIIILAGVGFGIWYFALRGDDKGGNNTNGNGSGNGNTVINDNNVNTNTNNTIVEPTSQKLICTQNQTSAIQGYNIKIDQELTVGFITGKINDANLIVVVTIPDDLYEQMKAEGDVESQMLYFEEQLKTSFNASFGESVKNMTSSHTGKVATIKIEIDVSQAGTETFAETKSYFEAEGYTCR